MSTDSQKKAAADRAQEFVSEGMIVGLGTGSTANHFVDGLGARVKSGLSVRGVATSAATAERAKGLNIPLLEFDEVDTIDVTIDGADEVDGDFRLIKGAGGALLREKMVAHASRQMVVIVDDSKMVERLGGIFPLPVEVVGFGAARTVRRLQEICRAAGCEEAVVSLREREPGQKFETDGGNIIADCACHLIPDAERLARSISDLPGVVEHGLFLNLASHVIVAGSGSVDVLTRPV